MLWLWDLIGWVDDSFHPPNPTLQIQYYSIDLLMDDSKNQIAELGQHNQTST